MHRRLVDTYDANHNRRAIMDAGDRTLAVGDILRLAARGEYVVLRLRTT